MADGEVHKSLCAACKGKGWHWYAFNFKKGITLECTMYTWVTLPESKRLTGRGHYIRGNKIRCNVCGGSGKIAI